MCFTNLSTFVLPFSAKRQGEKTKFDVLVTTTKAIFLSFYLKLEAVFSYSAEYSSNERKKDYIDLDNCVTRKT